MRKQHVEAPRPDPPRLWTVIETAAFLAVPVSTLYYWSYRGDLGPRVLHVGRCLRYEPSDVVAWARSQVA